MGYPVVDGSGIADRLGSAHTAVAGARGVCTICDDEARAIFLAKNDQRSRDRMATRLAQEYGTFAL